MKRKMTTLAFYFVLSSAFSQVNIWTWMKGSPGYNVPANYGSKTISNALNDPGGRETPATFTDQAGNLWLFGGLKTNGKGSDLWKYTVGTGEWCWMGGDSADNTYGSYGNKGIASSLCRPGARNQSMGWTDMHGDLWLFGGFGYAAHTYGYLNDLWKYDMTHGLWTWISGDSTVSLCASYGIKGMASSTNKPGPRYSAMTCSDSAGNLWMFGGKGITRSSQGLLNDLWKFDIHTYKWVWMSGDDTTASPGSYGTMGLSQPSDRPCARCGGKYLMDAAGNTWLFGGYSVNGAMNDLWKYNIASGEWTWMSGSNTAGQAGVYGTKGLPGVGCVPGSRSDFGGWIVHNTIWIFGGYSEAGSAYGSLNDLWKFDTGSGFWTWMNGDSLMDQPGFYGTMGVPLVVNKPTSKKYLASWTDDKENLWLFGGGADYSYQNDLWKYPLRPVAGLPEYARNDQHFFFPNPNNGSFTVVQPGISSINIYDLNGKLVFTDRSGSASISHLLDEGVYLLEIYAGKEHAIRKMTVVK